MGWGCTAQLHSNTEMQRWDGLEMQRAEMGWVGDAGMQRWDGSEGLHSTVAQQHRIAALTVVFAVCGCGCGCGCGWVGVTSFCGCGCLSHLSDTDRLSITSNDTIARDGC